MSSALQVGIEKSAAGADFRAHHPASVVRAWHRLRLGQIRAASMLMRDLNRSDRLVSLLGTIRNRSFAKQLIDLAAGYNRVFPDLPTARLVAAGFSQHGHDTPENGQALSDLMLSTRPSDYPVLHHLGRQQLNGLRVFDLGGTMGNLFYLYGRYLEFPPSLRWTVHDLPGHLTRGRELASARNESRLQFSDDAHGAANHDVLLISGALHYFDFSLPEYLADLRERPRHVLVNRTPLVNAPDAATIQYTHGIMVACKLLNRADLIAGMSKLGYECADSWSAPEFSIKLPYDPGYWVKEYSGLYFRAKN
jgi:putative methyltransferase (TIGR04325 family)